MKKITVLSILLLSLISELALADAYYVRSQSRSPWNQNNYEEDMDAVFGVGGWLPARFETVNANDLFSSANDFIYMEGSDSNANAMEAFITTNKAQMEAWVFAGGTLFLNAAPNQGDGMDMGFGVNLVYRDFSRTTVAADPSHPIFHGPFGVAGSSFTGSSFGHATVNGAGLNPLLVDNGHGRIVMGEMTHGRGVAFFGGMTSRNFHSPKPQVTYLHRNIRIYQATIKGATLSYTRQITMNPGDNTNVQVTLNNRDDFPINATITYPGSSLNVTGPADLAVAKEDSEFITVNIATSLTDEGSHTVKVKFDLDQGETFTAEINVDIVHFEQMTQNNSFDSYYPDLTADGSKVILASNADLAGTSKPTSARDLFIYNTTTMQYSQITQNQASRQCANPVISGNGEYAAALCNSSLDAGRPNSNATYELYYFDLTANTVKQVNTDSNTPQYSGVSQVAINHAGDKVYFSSNYNLDPSVGNGDGSAEVFLYDVNRDEVQQMSNFNYNSNDVKSISTDYEGKLFVVVSRGNPLGLNSRRYWRAFGGTSSQGVISQITSNNSTRHTEGVAISGNGETVAIQSRDNLESGVSANNRHQIFRAELDGTNIKQLTFSSTYHSYEPSISNDGNKIVFRSTGSNAGTNNASNNEVFMYDFKSNRMRAMTEINASRHAYRPKISADGGALVFYGNADWITGDNPSNRNQVFYQTNLGRGSVSKYEDPDVQYAPRAYLNSQEEDEESTKTRVTSGSAGGVLFIFMGLLAAMNRRKTLFN